MSKMPNNKYWLNHTIKTIGVSEEFQNYQVRYKYFKNTEILKYLIVKVKFINFSVRIRIYNRNIGI